MSYPVPVELIDRALEVIRGELEAMVEVICELRQDEHGQIVPVPGSATPDEARHGESLLQLVRDMEAVSGRFAEHQNPQWLDDLVDGKWSLS
ncbi:hypothetical protein HW532_18405 [Kaustia mangrovi]|uniref:Uncharacterized protein n=1 Tax=Kaustia mangrovi TaxID=2593653 RepID=A0A7S8C7A0_9HYPH|nr:hypothetical protein [Kaustia mangrovi]QPC44494.1 hypothetical protein HW532_18405 [Kaustia mangrovi]